MKKIALIAFASIFLVTACKKKVESSTMVVKVPKFELIGPTAFSTPAGPGSYVDPGVKYTDESGVESTITTPTTSDVNLAAPGFYSCSYELKTDHGYKLKASRLVLVTPVSPSDDYSGVYARTSNGQTVNVTKIGTGLYTTDNVGGVAANNAFIFDVYFGLLNDTDIVVPLQPNVVGGGELYCDQAKFHDNGATQSFQWVVRGAGFGTSLRKFVK